MIRALVKSKEKILKLKKDDYPGGGIVFKCKKPKMIFLTDMFNYCDKVITLESQISDSLFCKENGYYWVPEMLVWMRDSELWNQQLKEILNETNPS